MIIEASLGMKLLSEEEFLSIKLQLYIKKTISRYNGFNLIFDIITL
ncbi:uncharacterized protein METZ01_LOCUS54576 [marine metagenome]|uniref:Uncharacterized protein n=1 Tax=marine metagenome TaxID=408172 RepID=A0A381SC99_9ZZZZ